MYDGSQYRLVVSGDSTGAANAVSIGESGTSLGLDNTKDPVTTYQVHSNPQASDSGRSVSRAREPSGGQRFGRHVYVSSTDSLQSIADQHQPERRRCHGLGREGRVAIPALARAGPTARSPSM